VKGRYLRKVNVELTTTRMDTIGFLNLLKLLGRPKQIQVLATPLRNKPLANRISEDS
jgi:hypothetical protein